MYAILLKCLQAINIVTKPRVGRQRNLGSISERKEILSSPYPEGVWGNAVGRGRRLIPDVGIWFFFIDLILSVALRLCGSLP